MDYSILTTIIQTTTASNKFFTTPTSILEADLEFQTIDGRIEELTIEFFWPPSRIGLST